MTTIEETARMSLHIRRDGCDGDCKAEGATLLDALSFADAVDCEIRGYMGGRLVLIARPRGEYRWV